MIRRVRIVFNIDVRGADDPTVTMNGSGKQSRHLFRSTPSVGSVAHARRIDSTLIRRASPSPVPSPSPGAIASCLRVCVPKANVAIVFAHSPHFGSVRWMPVLVVPWSHRFDRIRRECRDDPMFAWTAEPKSDVWGEVEQVQLRVASQGRGEVATSELTTMVWARFPTATAHHVWTCRQGLCVRYLRPNSNSRNCYPAPDGPVLSQSRAVHASNSAKTAPPRKASNARLARANRAVTPKSTQSTSMIQPNKRRTSEGPRLFASTLVTASVDNVGAKSGFSFLL